MHMACWSKLMSWFSVKLSYSSQLLNILSSCEPSHAKWSIQLSKSVRHTCIFHKYLWHGMFVMSAKSLARPTRATGCPPRRWELVVLRTVRRYNLLFFTEVPQVFRCCCFFFFFAWMSFCGNFLFTIYDFTCKKCVKMDMQMWIFCLHVTHCYKNKFTVYIQMCISFFCVLQYCTVLTFPSKLLPTVEIGI